MTPEFWKNRRVLVTGHTGFRGAWLCLWLQRMGAQVSGLADEPKARPMTRPNLWTQLALADVHHYTGDISDVLVIEDVLARESPEIVLHIGAQSATDGGGGDPVRTVSASIVGAVALLDAITRAPATRACVIATAAGDRPVSVPEGPGNNTDLFSVSNHATELLIAAMRRNYFAGEGRGGHACAVATARCGSVIGGGDWSPGRLVPDIVTGCMGEDQSVLIRCPDAVGRWQHVLEPLRGYLMLAEHLATGDTGNDRPVSLAWDFDPKTANERPVIELADAMVAALGRGYVEIEQDRREPPVQNRIEPDLSGARHIGWTPRLGFDRSVALTADWYKAWHGGAAPADLCGRQIDAYMKTCGDVSARRRKAAG